jgi:DNA-binding winged helix-turn-helix (wHTH) protein
MEVFLPGRRAGRLRRALADGGQDGCIQTVRGVGYRLARATVAAAHADDATNDRRPAAGWARRHRLAPGNPGAR